MYKSQLQQDDLEGCAILFDSIREQYKKHQDKDEQLAQQFESHIHETLEKQISNHRLENTLFYRPDLPEYEQSKEIQIAKNDLYEICSQKFEDLLTFSDPALCPLFTQMMDSKNAIINELLLLSQLHSEEQTNLQQQIEHNSQQQIQQIQRSSEQKLIQQQQFYTQEMSQSLKDLQIMKAELERQGSIIASQQQKQTQLNEENDRLSQIIQQMNHSKSQSISQLNSLNKDIQRQVRQNQNKVYFNTLTESEMITTIGAVLQHKGSKRENMERTVQNYLHTFLNDKKAVIDQLGSILQGVQLFESNVEIKVFGKVLRNECDWNFLEKIRRTNTVFGQVLKSQLEMKSDLRSESEIDSQVHQKMNGSISLEESQYLLQYLFNRQESEKLGKMIPNSAKGMVKFGEFKLVVLNYLLKQHEDKINPFVFKFKLNDSDDDGILDHAQFKHLVRELASIDEPFFLRRLDPIQENKIFLSDCIQLFDQEKINNQTILSLFKPTQ